MTFPQTEFPRGLAPPPLGLPVPRALPAGHRAPLRGPREVAGAKGARGSGARRGRVRTGGGGCVPARVRGRGRGCAKHAAGQGAGRASDPGSPESDGRTAGGHTRENPGRTRSAPTRREAAHRPRRPLLPIFCPQRPRSVQPSSKVRQCRLCAHALVTAVTLKKKNLLTFLFLTPAEILLRVPLAQFYSSKSWPCLCFPKTCLPPAFD